MRVLLITDWPRHEGGIETYHLLLRRELQARGDEVRLLTSAAGSAAFGSADYVAYASNHPAAQALLQIANPIALAGVRSAVRAFQPDVVLVSMFEMHLSPAIFRALADVPTVLNIAYYKPICPTGLKLRTDGSLCRAPAGVVCWRGGCLGLAHWLRDQPRYALIGRALERVQRILTCSEWMVAELAAAGLGATRVWLPIAETGAGFRRSPASEPLFVYTGRLAVEKGLDLLLHAFARLCATVPAARLRVVGDGPLRQSLELLAGELGIASQVVFCGPASPSGVEAELAAAWALVAPSRWAEPFGLSAAEAIAHGVPVIASATGGLAETVREGVGGLLFENGSVDGLAGCLAAVAAGSRFPRGSLPGEVTLAMRTRHALAPHVEQLRGIFQEAGAPA